VSRPTVRPPDGPMREPYPTVSDPDALEAARVASLRSDSPPSRTSSSSIDVLRKPADSFVEIATAESDIETLEEGDQLVLLRARMSPLDRVPRLVFRLEDLGEVVKDPKTAYVLGFVDGILPLETIVDVAGIPELDTLRILDGMIDQGVVLLPT